MVSSLKIEYSVIIYTPLCHSKPIRLMIIFETQRKIFEYSLITVHTLNQPKNVSFK